MRIIIPTNDFLKYIKTTTRTSRVVVRVYILFFWNPFCHWFTDWLTNFVICVLIIMVLVYGYLIYLFSELPKLGENPIENSWTNFCRGAKNYQAIVRRSEQIYRAAQTFLGIDSTDYWSDTFNNLIRRIFYCFYYIGIFQNSVSHIFYCIFSHSSIILLHIPSTSPI